MVGVDCGGLSVCPLKSTQPFKAGWIGIFVAFIVVGFIFFRFKEAVEQKFNKLLDSAVLLDNQGTADESQQGKQENETEAEAVERIFAAQNSKAAAVASRRKSLVLKTTTAHTRTNTTPGASPPNGMELMDVYPDAVAGKSMSPMHAGTGATGTTGGSLGLRRKKSNFHIEFEDMSLVLADGVTKVMSSVSGQFLPSRLCAIMGPSGAGKTTIINLVTGKVPCTTGIIKINGVVEPLSKYKKLLGFVPQEDVMLRELTVRENIEFSARYRLPISMTEIEIEEQISRTIRELGLSHVQHSIIGDEHTRGLSGGQRKRVNIGIELVADPTVLFLDEPTSVRLPI